MSKIKLEELCLEITNKCLLECIHCSSMSSFSSKEELKFELIKKIIDDFRELGGVKIEFSGGEPIFHKDIYEIIEYAKKKNLEVSLYTNGLGVGADILHDEDIQRLINIGTNKFLFSLHGSKNGTHEKITEKEGSFQKTISVIKKLKEKDAYVGVHFVPTKINYQELEESCKMADDIGVNEFAVLRFVPQGRGWQNRSFLELREKEVEQLLKAVKKVKEDYKFIRLGCPISFSFFLDRQNAQECKIGKNMLTIRSDGAVTLCPAFKYKKIIGNIKEKELKELWEESPILTRIRKLDYRRFISCSKCEYFNFCKGGCLAQHFYTYDEIFKGKDPWCDIAKKIYFFSREL